MRVLVTPALLLLPACGVYGKEIVLYDSRAAPARGNPTPDAAKPNAPTTQAADPRGKPDFEQILRLEQTLDEIDRLVSAGVDAGGALRQKQGEIDRELADRLQSTSAAELLEWRKARAAQLLRSNAAR